MDKVIKLLWWGDAVAQTGFARITHCVLDELVKTGDYDIAVQGVNYHGDPHEYPYKIWPAQAGPDPLGFQRLPKLAASLKPDIVVLFNDLWVVAKAAQILRDSGYEGKIVTYFPIDGTGYDSEWIKALYQIDKVLVYTRWAYEQVQASGYLGGLYIVPHGADREKFFPIPQKEARKQLMGLNDSDFIVFNGNRNQPRKRIDITIKGFCRFAADKPDARLYLHMGVRDIGWPIIPLFQRECKKSFIRNPEERLILTHQDLSPANSVPLETLNMIYNVCDVGLNTGLGEGWGLVNFEQAACGVPQIVPGFSATAELFGDGRGKLLPIVTTLTHTQTNHEGGLVDENSLVEALQAYYDNKDLRMQHAAAMYDYVQDRQFDWKTIGQQWDRHIKSVL